MADFSMKVQKRTEFGKGAARRARRDNLTPAILYAGGEETQHLLFPAQELFLALRQANALFELDIEGKKVLALPKAVQRDAIKPVIDHVDFLLVKAGQKVSVEIPLHVIGEAADREAVVNTELVSLPVLAPVSDIPEGFEVSIEGLEIGSVVAAGEVKLPEGVELDVDPEDTVVSILAPAAEEEPEEIEGEEGAEGAEGEEGAEAAEGDEE